VFRAEMHYDGRPVPLRIAGFEDVGVTSLSTDTSTVAAVAACLMDGTTQRNQQPTPPPDCGDVATLIMPNGEPDWTEDLPKTDHVRFFLSTDWSKSSLGPLSTWSPTLQLFTGFVLADSRAACLWWYVNDGAYFASCQVLSAD
jgi:hypothetical protein